MYLYHYFDKSTGPFRNLSELPRDEAEKVLAQLKAERPNSMSAKRDAQYMQRREGYEKLARELFGGMGGHMTRKCPHYMTVEHSDWLYSWFEIPAFVRIPIEEFDCNTLSFTYGDMHPTFSPIVTDGKECRRRLYRYEEILGIIEKYGLPQNIPPVPGEVGHPYYVEAQVWSDETVRRYAGREHWEEL